MAGYIKQGDKITLSYQGVAIYILDIVLHFSPLKYHKTT